jgi:hypothetical protein
LLFDSVRSRSRTESSNSVQATLYPSFVVISCPEPGGYAYSGSGRYKSFLSVLRIRDVYPGSRILIFTPLGSWIPDPKQQQKRGVRKFCCHTFLCSHKFYKTENYFTFDMLKKKMWANFQRIMELFTQIFVTTLSKICVWDPGFGKNLFRIPDPYPGIKKTPDPRSGSATLIPFLD